MRSDIIKAVIKKAKTNKKKVIIVLDTISGHGGYSSGQTWFTIDPNKNVVKFEDNYLTIDQLCHSVKDTPSWSNKIKIESLLTFGVEDGEINTAYIEYETIKLIGLN